MVVKSSGVETVISSGVEIVFISLHFDKAQYRLAQGDNGGITISKELQFCHIERSRDTFKSSGVEIVYSYNANHSYTQPKLAINPILH